MSSKQPPHPAKPLDSENSKDNSGLKAASESIPIRNQSGKQSEMELFGSSISSMLSARTASALSMMTGEDFEFRLNGVGSAGSDYIDKLSKRHSEDVCAVYLKAEGEIRAAMLLYLENENAKSLASKLTGQQIADKLDSLGRSSISEVCNILFAGCFLNSVCDVTGLKTFSSVPGVGFGELRAMSQYPVAEIAETSHDVIAAESELVGQKSGIVLKMLLVVSKEDAQKMVTLRDPGKHEKTKE